MVCVNRSPTYANANAQGLDLVSSAGDGYSMLLRWNQAYPDSMGFSVAYNIYFADTLEGVFSEGAKFVVPCANVLTTTLSGFTPGDNYWFSVKATEYDPRFTDLAPLQEGAPDAPVGVKVYPSGTLLANISDIDTQIPVSDIDTFPNFGIVKIDHELMRYSSISDPYLIVTERGVYGSNISEHRITPGLIHDSGGVFKQNQALIGAKNGANRVFHTAEKFVNGLFNGSSYTITIRYNSNVLTDGYYILSESDGYGTGFDTIVFVSTIVPATGSSLVADYVTRPSDGYGQYDGYDYSSGIVEFYTGFEDEQHIIYQSENKFSYPHEVWNARDGYRENKGDGYSNSDGYFNSNFITTDYTSSDETSADLRQYDYSGWHRTDPADIINGVCVGSYIGGEFYCADGYGGTGFQVRGLTVQEQNNQRQEVLLSVTGSRCVLVKRMWKGKRCYCVDSTRETPEQRCPRCFGTGYVSGYEQFFDSRRSDGTIMVRFSPFVEDLEHQEPGLESKVTADCWTTVAPAIKDRDFIIRLNEDGTEEWRYEVLNVTKNTTFVELLGQQKFSVQRVRKTDPIYMWRAFQHYIDAVNPDTGQPQRIVFRDTATMPTKFMTSVGGGGGIPPHTHAIVINENITTLSQVNQTTSVIQGHNHPIIAGRVTPMLGHTHTIVLI